MYLVCTKVKPISYTCYSYGDASNYLVSHGFVATSVPGAFSCEIESCPRAYSQLVLFQRRDGAVQY
jgi:hypothetical protein